MKVVPRSKPSAAFTLIEVMMAAAVLIAGLVGMIQAVSSGSQIQALATKQTIAMKIIQNEIAKVHVQNWSVVSSYPLNTNADISSTVTDTTNDSYQSAAGNLQNFTCYRYVTLVKTDMLMITYTVQWQTGVVGNPNMQTYSRKGSTYVANNGLYVAYQRS